MLLSDNFMSLFKRVLAPLSLVLFTFLIYYPTLIYGFVFDDLPTIIEYIHARKIDFWGQFFQNPRWISRYLNQVTFVNWGQNPYAYRIFDICLHMAIGLMVFYFLMIVLSRYKKDDFIQQNSFLISFFTAALFLLHPVQTQTATYITQIRLEGLVAFLFFAVLLCFVCAAYVKNTVLKYFLYAASLIFAALATGTKEIAVVLPFITVVVDWFFVAQGDWNDFKNRIPLHLAYSCIVFGLFFRYGYLVPKNIANTLATPVHNNRGNILTPTSHEFITTYYYFITQFKVILHYICIFIFPVNLCFDYDYKLSTGIFNFDVVVPFLVLLSICGFAIYRFRHNFADFFTFGFLWFFILVLPRASFFISTELICDYKTYTASFGIFFLIAYAVVRLLNLVSKLLSKSNFVYMQPAIIFTVVLVLGFSTKTRNYVWSSELLFWKDAAEKSGKARCYHNYGNAYADMGDIKSAMNLYEEAIKIDNFYAEPHINLGLMYQNMGQDEVALEHYKRALEIGEGHPELFNNLGILNMKHHAFVEAENCFKQALQLRPYHSSALFNMGNLYYLQGKPKEAEKFFDDALHGSGTSPQLFYMYGVVSFELGNVQKAIELLQNLDIKYQRTAFYLGASYFTIKNYRKAAECLDVAYQGNKIDSTITYNYALSLMNIGEYEKAVHLFESCKGDDQRCPFAGLHHARCLVEIGKKSEASGLLKKLVKQTKNIYVKQDIVEYMKQVKIA